MKQVIVVIPRDLFNPVTIKTISNVGLPGPRGDVGPEGPTGPAGPGILSNIVRITASSTPPVDPEVNDIWIDLS